MLRILLLDDSKIIDLFDYNCVCSKYFLINELFLICCYLRNIIFSIILFAFYKLFIFP